jgi:hypothetical protein
MVVLHLESNSREGRAQLYSIIAEIDRGFERRKPKCSSFDRRKACYEVVAVKRFGLLYLRLVVH